MLKITLHNGCFGEPVSHSKILYGLMKWIVSNFHKFFNIYSCERKWPQTFTGLSESFIEWIVSNFHKFFNIYIYVKGNVPKHSQGCQGHSLIQVPDVC